METNSLTKEDLLRMAIERHKHAAEVHPKFKPDCDVITEALEKQIPKRLKDRYFGICMCGKLVETFSGDYCSHCGQAIDWSE